MRAFARAAAALLLCAPVLALSSAQAQERRVVVTPGADYFGADYNVVTDVDQAACEAACSSDQQCHAFTYNVSARWCFLKSAVGELRAVEGAVSGRIATADEATPDVEAARISELGFLPQTLVDQARRFVGRLDEAQGIDAGLDGTLAAADVAANGGDLLGASELYRAALKLAPERFDLWTRYTDAALRASSDDWQVQQQLLADRTAGAINAYLRAVSPEDQASALSLLATSLALREEWKPAIRAYRASLARIENPEVRAAYDTAVAEHGFRIVDNTVDADAAAPRICLNFSDALPQGQANLSDFVAVEGGASLSVEASGQQICIDGVEHGQRYHVTVRQGLPSADGETLAKSAELDLFVRDRAPSVRFLGNAYVLPAGGEPTIPVVTVNTTRVDATLYRIGDRQLARTLADGNFLSQLSSWEADEIETSKGEKVWTGSVDVGSEINREITTAVPVGEIEAKLQPGAYILTAQAVNGTGQDWEPKATQWFIVTDLGLTTLSGNDGLHVMVRSLGSAGPVADVKLRLVATNNEVLGEATTDAAGYAKLAPGLMRGTGGLSPQLLVAQTEAGDYSFLDLSRAAMDLTDRGVEGRTPPKPLDVFLTTERGIYRVGETVYATALVRDATAVAAPGVPLTGVVTRPDGKEEQRFALADQGLGGNVTPINLPGNAMRGSWRIGIYADVKAEALAETSFLVEDFEPERLDFELAGAAAAIDPAAPGELSVDARFLYGAPASNLSVEGETQLKPVRNLAAYPGYLFGLETEPFTATSESLPGTTTDESGHATVAIALPDAAQSSRPLEATINVRVLDSGDRPVERSITLPVAATRERLAIKPLFEGAAAENGPVAFELIAVDAAGARVARTGVAWALYKVDTNFQWYRADGRWSYETVETRSRVANGSADIAADRAARIDASVEWGTYELEVGEDSAALPASVKFEAGWYVEAKALDTPEALKVSLDKPKYAVGETARVHLETRFPGVALVMVVDDRLITTTSVEVSGESADVDLPVTRAWGPGAYVTAVLYRPMDIEAKRMPARAIGLAWAGVDPGERALQVSLAAPETMRPRQAMEVGITLAGLPAGSEAYVTLAAVDLGILNLTRYETPDPGAYYFGQRRLGVSIRDLYNQLIDRMQGVRGTVRSGGDAGLTRFEGTLPTEQLVAFHSGVVEIGPDGTAHVSVPIPDFNGTVRLMAMAWTREGVGRAEKDVLVRDPVVLTASLPHFLAPGDQSRLSLDLASVEGIAGPVQLSVSSGGTAVTIDPAFAARPLELSPGAREQILVPITGSHVGDDVVAISLTLPDGQVLEKAVNVAVRLNEPPVALSSFVEVAPGGTLSVGPDALTGLVPGTASVQVSASGAGRLNVPAILRALDRYPYGCTEQIASRAMPLVYLNEVAVRAGLSGDPDIRDRVVKAVAGVLANQSAAGSFGLWAPGSEDFWLDAYVTDFLSRARRAGFEVPAQGFDLALTNLKNKLAYASDFESGGEDIAYALYVLAANGRASIGDLRYYVETKLDAFATPLAKAQLGAALALYGDTLRAETAFRAAMGELDTKAQEKRGYRADYGSVLRDSAATLTLASETKTGVDVLALTRRIEAERQASTYTSTQEDAWSLLAAHALMTSLAAPDLQVDGEALKGPLFRNLDADSLAAAPLDVVNNGERPVEVGLTVRGVPVEPEPAGGNGYTLERAYYTLEGEPADLAAVAQGDRLVAVLSVTTTEGDAGRLILDDPLPAGFEIDNPHLLKSGDVAALNWLTTVDQPAHVEFRADRFVAAFDRAGDGPTAFQFAYVVRAVSPGSFAHPAALIEDMYRPELRARTGSGRVEVVGPLR
jgi:uncharacterized protein YfaS (alpha-2-macroglobulin family)